MTEAERAEPQAELGELLRRLRRQADLSQRELADRAGVPQATVARIESGRVVDPRYRTVERLIRAAGGRLQVGGHAGAGARPPAAVPHDGLRDQAGRRYPAHLDVWEVREPKDWPGAWWAEWYNLPPEKWPLPLPPATYELRRDHRDRRRRRRWIRDAVTVRRVTGAALPLTSWRFVAELPDGELVGELRAHERSPHLLWGGEALSSDPEVKLDGVLVAVDCRGLGIGRRLLRALVEEVAPAGLRIARVLAEEPGVGFLIACGFRIEAARPYALRLEGPVTAGRPRRW